MPISEYSLRLQSGTFVSFISKSSFNKLFFVFKGITGGFAPPTPNAIHTVTLPLKSGEISIASSTRQHGTPNLQDELPKKISAEDKHTVALVDELYGILKTIPTESPPGSEDIYGLDTSIAWGSEDLQWMNGGPSGCGGGTSYVQPTAEDKEKFKRAVDIVHELIKKDK